MNAKFDALVAYIAQSRPITVCKSISAVGTGALDRSIGLLSAEVDEHKVKLPD